jgi:anaerobic magnesium-protoporphyrin IX monomethyl ester cyclase
VFTDHLTSEEIVARRNKLETRVRDVLGIPFNPGRAAMRFEHSMGQGLPDFILRNTAAQGAAAE